MEDINQGERRRPEEGPDLQSAAASNTPEERDKPAPGSGPQTRNHASPSSSSSSAAHEATASISTPQQQAAAAGSLPPVDVVVVRQQQGGAGEGERLEGESNASESQQQQQQQQQDGYTVVVAVKSKPSADTSNQREGAIVPAPEPHQDLENKEETGDLDRDKATFEAARSASKARAQRGGEAVRSSPYFRHRGDAEKGEYEEEGEAQLPMPPSSKAHQQHQVPAHQQHQVPSPPSSGSPQRKRDEGEEETDVQSTRRHQRQRDEWDKKHTATARTEATSSAAGHKKHAAQAVTPPGSPPPSHPDRKNEVDAGKASACHEYHQGDHPAGPHSHRQRGASSSPSVSPKAEETGRGLKEHQRHREEGADKHSKGRHDRGTEESGRGTAATSSTAAQGQHRVQGVTPPGSPPSSHPNRENEVDAGHAPACHEYHHGDHSAGPHSHLQRGRQASSSPSAPSSPSPETEGTRQRHAQVEAGEQSTGRHHRETDQQDRATAHKRQPAHRTQAVTPPHSPPSSHPHRENEVDAGEASACHEYHDGDHRAGPHSHLQSARQVDSSPPSSPSPGTERRPRRSLEQRQRHGEDEADVQSRRRGSHRETDAAGKATAATSAAAHRLQAGAPAVTPPASPPRSHPNRENEVDAGKASACHEYHDGDHRAGPHSHLQSARQVDSSPPSSPSPGTERRPRRSLEQRQRHGEDEADVQSRRRGSHRETDAAGKATAATSAAAHRLQAGAPAVTPPASPPRSHPNRENEVDAGKASACHEHHHGDHPAGPHSHRQSETAATSHSAAHRHPPHGRALAVTPPGSPPSSHPNRKNEVDAGHASACHESHHGDHPAGPHSHLKSGSHASSSPSSPSSPSPKGTRQRHGQIEAGEHSTRRHRRETDQQDRATAHKRQPVHKTQAVTPPGSPPSSHPHRENEVDAGKASACHEYHSGDHRAGPHSHRQGEHEASSSPSVSRSPKAERPRHGLEAHRRHGGEGAGEQAARRHHLERDGAGRERTAHHTTGDPPSSAAAHRHQAAQAVTPPGSPPQAHPDRENEVDAGKASACHEYHQGDHRAGPHSHLQSERHASSSPSASSPSPRPAERSTRRRHRETDETGRAPAATSTAAAHTHSHNREPARRAQAVTPSGSPPASHPHRENEVDAGRPCACHEYHQGDHRAGPHSHRQGDRQASSSPSVSPKREQSWHWPEAHQRQGGEEADQPPFDMTRVPNGFQREVSSGSPSPSQRGQSPPGHTELENGYPPPHLRENNVESPHGDSGEGAVLRGSDARTSRATQHDGAALSESSDHHHQEGRGVRRQQHDHEHGVASCSLCRQSQGAFRGGHPAAPPSPPPTATNGDGSRQAGSPSACSRRDAPSEAHEGLVFSSQDVEEEFRHVLRDSLAHRADQAQGEGAGRGGRVDASRATHERLHAEGGRGEEGQLISNGVAPGHRREEQQRNREGETQPNGLSHLDNGDAEYQARVGAAAGAAAAEAAAAAAIAPRADTHRGPSSSSPLARPQAGGDEEAHVHLHSRLPPNDAGRDKRETSVSASSLFPSSEGNTQDFNSSAVEGQGLEGQQTPPPSASSSTHREEDRRDTTSGGSSSPNAASSPLPPQGVEDRRAAQLHQGPAEASRGRRSLSSSPSVKRSDMDKEVRGPSTPPHWKRREEEGASSPSASPSPRRHGRATTSSKARTKETAESQRGTGQRASSPSPSPSKRNGEPSGIPSPADMRRHREKAGKEHLTTATPADGDRQASKSKGKERTGSSSSPSPSAGHNGRDVQGPSPPPRESRRGRQEEERPSSLSPSPPSNETHRGGDKHHGKAEPSDFFESRLAEKKGGEEAHKKASAEEPLSSSAKHRRAAQGERSPSSSPSADQEGTDKKFQRPSHPPPSAKPRKGEDELSPTSSPSPSLPRHGEKRASGVVAPHDDQREDDKSQDSSFFSSVLDSRREGRGGADAKGEESARVARRDGEEKQAGPSSQPPAATKHRGSAKKKGSALPPFEQGREVEVEGDASSTVSSPSASPSPREAPTGDANQSAGDRPSTSAFVGPKKKEEVQKDKASSGKSLSPSPSPGDRGGEQEKKESLIPLSFDRRGSPEQKAKPPASSKREEKGEKDQGASPPPQKHHGAAQASPSPSPSLSPPPSRSHKGKAVSRDSEASSSSSSRRHQRSPPSSLSPSNRPEKAEVGEKREGSPEPTPEQIARRGLINDAFEEMRVGTDALKQVTLAAASNVSERVRMRAEEALQWAQEKREETGDVLGEAWRETKKTGAAARKQVADFINPE
ncbi:hypothetical protein ACSSS7_005006 [Eimeria intestinalis]